MPTSTPGGYDMRTQSQTKPVEKEKHCHLALVSKDTPCWSCGGITVIGPDGTSYCCDASELAALRGLRDEVIRRTEDEALSPSMDPDAQHFVTWTMQRLRLAKPV